MSHATRWLWSTQLKSHLAKIGDHCPSEGGEKSFLLISHDHMINESRDSVDQIPSALITKVIVRATELNNKIIYVLQTGASIVTNWGSYYKLGQLLLRNRAAITNWGKTYYKLGQVLQIRAIITNWDITAEI